MKNKSKTNTTTIRLTEILKANLDTIAKKYSATMTDVITTTLEYAIPKAYKLDDELVSIFEERKERQKDFELMKEIEQGQKDVTKCVYNFYSVSNHKRRILTMALIQFQTNGAVNFPAIKEIHKEFKTKIWKKLPVEVKEILEPEFLGLEQSLKKNVVEDIVSKMNTLDKRNLLK